MPEPAAASLPDLATIGAEFADRLAANGVPVPVHRTVWWSRVVLAAGPTTVGELYWLSRVTLIDRNEHLPVFDAVFAAVFGGPAPDTRDPADFRPDHRGHPTAPTRRTARRAASN